VGRTLLSAVFDVWFLALDRLLGNHKPEQVI
jgi:hypothetical protein